MRWALSDHARCPNETNLDTHYILPTNGLWNEYLRVRKGEIEDVEITPRAALQSSTPGTEATPEAASSASAREAPQVQAEPPGPRKLISNEPASPENYTSLARTPKLPAPPSQTLRPVPTSSLIPKLRWANIGWYYHWGTKQYDFTRGPGEIAGLVRGVCRRAVEQIPWEKVFPAGKTEEMASLLVLNTGRICRASREHRRGSPSRGIRGSWCIRRTCCHPLYAAVAISC